MVVYKGQIMAFQCRGVRGHKHHKYEHCGESSKSHYTLSYAGGSHLFHPGTPCSAIAAVHRGVYAGSGIVVGWGEFPPPSKAEGNWESNSDSLSLSAALRAAHQCLAPYTRLMAKPSFTAKWRIVIHSPRSCNWLWHSASSCVLNRRAMLLYAAKAASLLNSRDGCILVIGKIFPMGLIQCLSKAKGKLPLISTGIVLHPIGTKSEHQSSFGASCGNERTKPFPLIPPSWTVHIATPAMGGVGRAGVTHLTLVGCAAGWTHKWEGNGLS